MKHIKLFENWQEEIEKDLPFPRGHNFKDEDGAYAYRFRQLVADRDITSSLDKIKNMHKDGTLKRALDEQDINKVFTNLLEKDREDIAEYLYMIGYRVTDLKRAQDWSIYSKRGGGDDVKYSLRRYAK